MKYNKILVFRVLAFLVSTVLTIVALLLCLKLFDIHLMSHRHPGVADEDADEPTMRTMEYYPFTGGQIQAYKRERGQLPWSDFYNDFDVASGEYGFFIDFRLEAPPPKQDKEIRIVLTGGSTAQGWGGRTNADMFYQLLPTRLTQELQEHGQNCKVTVVNLAMGSSQIYQNFIALNKWAHPLQPDAIISFSGHNEIAVPLATKGDADQLASFQAGGLLHVLRYSASPQWLKKLAEYYPGIVRRTVLGSLVRLMYLSDYTDDWDANYLLSRIDPTYTAMPRKELQRRYRAALKSLTTDEIIDSVSIPLYENSLEFDQPRLSRHAGLRRISTILARAPAGRIYAHDDCHSGESQRPGSLCRYQVLEFAARLGGTRLFSRIARRRGSLIQRRPQACNDIFERLAFALRTGPLRRTRFNESRSFPTCQIVHARSAITGSRFLCGAITRDADWREGGAVLVFAVALPPALPRQRFAWQRVR